MRKTENEGKKETEGNVPIEANRPWENRNQRTGPRVTQDDLFFFYLCEVVRLRPCFFDYREIRVTKTGLSICSCRDSHPQILQGTEGGNGEEGDGGRLNLLGTRVAHACGSVCAD